MGGSISRADAVGAMTAPYLTPLEIAAGMVLPVASVPGADGRVRGQPVAAVEADPLTALEAEILPALIRAPCLVSFSGGRDSAAVLAAAARLARREGLPLPIPVTSRFHAGAPLAEESQWQELVVRHLGLGDWARLEYDDELDLVGPYAQRALTRHGLLWPANTHFHLPLLDLARGGSMLTGFGGDELFSAARQMRHTVLLRRQTLRSPRALLGVGLDLAPRPIRALVLARRSKLDAPWLRPAAKRLVLGQLASQAVAEPRGLVERMEWWQRLRYLRIAAHSLQSLAVDADVQLVHPLASSRFWSAVAAVAGPTGFAGRTAGTRRLFGSMLPGGLIERRTKANFDQVFWTRRSEEFAHRWNGSGVPIEWVDPEELRHHWQGGAPRAQSATLLQAAWLVSAGDVVQETAQCVRRGAPETRARELHQRQGAQLEGRTAMLRRDPEGSVSQELDQPV